MTAEFKIVDDKLRKADAEPIFSLGKILPFPVAVNQKGKANGHYKKGRDLFGCGTKHVGKQNKSEKKVRTQHDSI